MAGVMSVPVLGACVDFPSTAEKLAHTVLIKLCANPGGVGQFGWCFLFKQLPYPPGTSWWADCCSSSSNMSWRLNPLGTLKSTLVSKVPNKFSDKDCIFVSFMCNLPSLLFLTLKDKVTKTLPYSLGCESLRPYWMEPLQSFLLVWGTSHLKSGKKVYKRKLLCKVRGKNTSVANVCSWNTSRTELMANTWYHSSWFVRLHQLRACRMAKSR